LHTYAFTQTLLHRDSFTHKHFYTQTRLHASPFTHKLRCIVAKEKKMLQMISRKKIEMICEDSKLKPDEVHRKLFICRHFYTHILFLYAHTLLYTNAFTDGHTFFTHNPFTHKHFYTQTLLHTDPFTHKLFYTQSLLHTRMFTHKRLCTETLLDTNAFTHQRF
jgi:hypothetical protein